MSARHVKVLIIGSGPAGYTAAIYTARAMLEPVLIAGMEQGGQLMITTDVENYPGYADPVQGPWMMEQMLKQGGGAIVNMASILGWVGFASAPAYVAAKHGVLGLTKTAAVEYATQNVRINAVCPAFIYTPLLESAGMTEGTDAYNAIAALHPMKRMGKPEEVADLVLWLCSDGASFVTGSAYLVDGGYVAQ